MCNPQTKKTGSGPGQLCDDLDMSASGRADRAVKQGKIFFLLHWTLGPTNQITAFGLADFLAEAS